MKKLLTALVTALLAAGCGTGVAGNENKQADDKTTGSGNSDMQKSVYYDSAALLFSASVSVTGTGVDTPTAEANEKVAKIAVATVSIFDKDGKLSETINLAKVEPRIKGEILKFDSGFVGIKAGPGKVRFDFKAGSGETLYSTEGQVNLGARTIVNVNGSLDQVSIKKESSGPETLKTEIKEMDEKSYVSGQIIASLKEDRGEAELKAVLEGKGIKVSSLKKTILSSYTISFSSPSVAEALILANQTGKFAYVEPNGYVSIQRQ